MSTIEIKYNSQRDNDSWGGKLQPWAQCFYTSAIMLLSHYIKEYETKAKESEYVDDVEVNVGKPGIGEELEKKYNLPGRSGQYWIIQKEAIERKMLAAGFTGKMIFKEAMPIDEVTAAIDAGSPVIAGTGFGSGHVLLVCGHEEIGLKCEDPYGVGPTYSNTNGHQVLYTWPIIQQYFYSVTKQAGKMLAMYWQPAKG